MSPKIRILNRQRLLTRAKQDLIIEASDERSSTHIPTSTEGSYTMKVSDDMQGALNDLMLRALASCVPNMEHPQLVTALMAVRPIEELLRVMQDVLGLEKSPISGWGVSPRLDLEFDDLGSEYRDRFAGMLAKMEHGRLVKALVAVRPVEELLRVVSTTLDVSTAQITKPDLADYDYSADDYEKAFGIWYAENQRNVVSADMLDKLRIETLTCMSKNVISGSIALSNVSAQLRDGLYIVAAIILLIGDPWIGGWMLLGWGVLSTITTRWQMHKARQKYRQTDWSDVDSVKKLVEEVL